MRVTGGHAKGRILRVPKGKNIRPTTDQVREAIFNIIGHDLRGRTVLDLFAGTGSLGMEALSRNAARAVFLDISQEAVQMIHENLAALGFEASGVVLRRDLTRGIPRRHEAFQHPFDLVFMDPPYGKGLIPPLLKRISDAGILAHGAFVVAEQYKTEKLPSLIGQIHLKDIRFYGDTQINILDFEVTS